MFLFSKMGQVILGATKTRILKAEQIVLNNFHLQQLRLRQMVRIKGSTWYGNNLPHCDLTRAGFCSVFFSRCLYLCRHKELYMFLYLSCIRKMLFCLFSLFGLLAY
jgi:hypothetical protein